MGSLYTLHIADQVYASQGGTLTGYIAGAIGKRSDSYKRMVVAGVTAGVMGSFVVVFTSNFSSILGPATLGGSVLSFVPRLLTGILSRSG